jgi:nitrile hydratase accessory protein
LIKVPTVSPLLCKSLPLAADDAVKFNAPWEARAFAIIVQLASAGHFAWGEWVECFSKEVAAATAVEAAGGTPKTYYQQWLSAAENIMVAKGVTSVDQLTARKFAISITGSAHQLR